MIVVRLAGGLGNQLFQVMAALLIGERTGLSILLLTDGLAQYAAARKPDVLRLVRSKRILLAENVRVSPWVRWLSLRARAGRWLPILGLGDEDFPSVVNRGRMHGQWHFLDGYFQRGWTLELLREAQAAAQLDPSAMTDPGNLRCDCVIHIRGGDFLRLPSHAIVDIDYYSRCLSLAESEGYRSFGIVTDDRQHADEFLQTLRMRHPGLAIDLLPDHGSALTDFGTLRHARSRIIGNSTFAWWASACADGHGTTWAPDRFVRGQVRDFVLPCERLVSTDPGFGTPS